MTTATPVQGKILQVFGPVVDVQFPEGHVPNLYSAITVVDKQRGIDLVLEVAQQLGNSAVRTVAMSSTDGMSRGMPATDTGAPISVPVGDMTRGRLFDVLGGTLAPGSSPGTMTVSNNVTLGATATFQVDLWGYAPGTQYDQLVLAGVSDSLSLGGAALVADLNGFNPIVGSTFTIISGFGGDPGSFGSVALQNAAAFSGAGKSFGGEILTSDAKVLGNIFNGFITDPALPLVYHGLFAGLTLAVVIGGVQKGIENLSKFLMPVGAWRIIRIRCRAGCANG